MGKQYPTISADTQAFIEQQHIFFVGTAAADGRVKISPKGQDTLRVLDANRVAWLNLTGSGNETAAHLLEVNRIPLMWCAFEGKPNILRLYGTATVYHPRDAEWAELLPLFPPLPGSRQIVVVTVDLVQTSCGMAVPSFDYRAERDELNHSMEPRGPKQVAQYWHNCHVRSLDGKLTSI
ncbi:pyridoxamine 5'-phosphate oxidase family protein [Hymenobacter taeanensis]|uniref:Pyridoxamine 5'-phosphate oxidase family protein n=1 Tax=Hymenobacter taeanensis TaxID=2735321 RepID=A0A6M6BLM3_9BACT|nr:MULTISPECIES: pyridoxamine 5'-phosphate oxidase family protein [Hymenobacter]QJX49046.1 pyridoxamine 5'-phosphate oxidase family protein [Hymenobacter taeanensis]UOQ81435.1 pyridoxamine 5'-phosphate oxidase family protein [Hymenobacter sp. 5414T-23]